jgi:hypothetical protein
VMKYIASLHLENCAVESSETHSLAHAFKYSETVVNIE